jgi:EpsI family protein
MLVMYWVGARWREDGRDEKPMPPAPRLPLQRLAAITAAALTMLVAWPALGHALLVASEVREPLKFVPPAPAGGWNLAPDNEVISTWRPALEGEAGIRTFVYTNGNRRVALVVAAFRDQTQEAQVGSSVNQLVRSLDPDWKQTSRELVQTNATATAGLPNEVHGAELRATRRPERLLIWQWYWAGQGPTASAGQTKIELALARLLRRPDTALWVAAYTPLDEGRTEAERALRDFVHDMGLALQKSFVETAR